MPALRLEDQIAKRSFGERWMRNCKLRYGVQLHRAAREAGPVLNFEKTEGLHLPQLLSDVMAELFHGKMLGFGTITSDQDGLVVPSASKSSLIRCATFLHR